MAQNRVNLFRLQILIIDGGLLVLRNLIDQTLIAQGITLSACLRHEKSKITRLKHRGVITEEHYDILFPTSGHAPTTSEMDLTLIIFLLRCVRCFGLKKNFDWQATPLSTDVSIEADICRLKDHRNDMSHKRHTTDIQTHEFVTLWNDIEKILVRLSPTALNIQQTIDYFKDCPLDADEVKRLQEEIEKWKNYEADVDRLTEEMIDVKERVTEVEKSQEDIKRRLDEEKSNEGVSYQQAEEEKYQKRKRELRHGLITFYKTRHNQVFLSPLFEEKDTPLASFYIRPKLNSIVSTPMKKHEDRLPVKSLSEMFKTENKQKREIYVLADAGLGKTAFSKYLANLWCQAHCPDEDLNEFLLKDDIDCMQEFDFLFLVLLRDAGTSCSIDDLIFEKIISDLGLEEKLSEDFLLKILKNEKCLVILDGLDEWTHPEKECKRSPPRSIPHRNDWEKCTILTTTRPWKLGVSNLNSYQLGKKAELTKLCYSSAVTLTERILQRWKSHLNKDALENDVKQFMEIISTSQSHELASVPLLLIYTTCLWCEGVQIGNSKCDLYINIVELLLSKTIQVQGVFQQLQELSASEIPECFAEYDNCTKYYPLLMHLGRLAYYTLLNETKENRLVFDGSVAEKYLTQDEMKFTLHSGMLSESTSKTSRKKYSKVSFSHKTVQEFFAAIFISSENNAQKNVLEKCKNIQDIVDMSKICEFISEMNVDRICAISKDLMSVINKDHKTYSYRRTTTKCDAPFYVSFIYDNPLYDIQKIFMSCLKEISERGNIQLCLQDFFIDADNMHSEQLQRLLKLNKTNIKSLYIDTDSPRCYLGEIIDLFSLTNLPHIQKLCLYCNIRSVWGFAIDRILFPSLKCVSLQRGRWTELSGNLELVQNLQYLYIENFTLSHKILETIFNFISGQKSMKELTLLRLDCAEHARHDCQRLNLNLSQHSTLSQLHLELLPCRIQLKTTTPSLFDVKLRNINLDESSLLLSCDMLNIGVVELWQIEMSAGSLQNFITVLENLPRSVTVRMANIKPETEYERVRENIRSSQTFHVLDDSNKGCLLMEFETME